MKTTLGLTRKTIKYPTLIIKNKEGIVTKSFTSEEKVKTLTNTLKSIFTEEDQINNFNASHKIKANSIIEHNIYNITPHTTIPQMENKYKIAKEEIEAIINKLKIQKAQIK